MRKILSAYCLTVRLIVLVVAALVVIAFVWLPEKLLGERGN
jgi:hypothetical protein